METYVSLDMCQHMAFPKEVGQLGLDMAALDEFHRAIKD